jgi:hypothetical protein
MPMNAEFGQRFTDLLKKHNLRGLDAPYMYLGGVVSKATLNNWKKGAPAPDPQSSVSMEKFEAVISRFPSEDAREWLALLERSREQDRAD